MINFGVREVAGGKANSGPGYEYVLVDPGLAQAASASQPSTRKRAARNHPVASLQDTTAKQDAKILRELAALDRENHRDVSIPVPVRSRDNSGRGNHTKSTPAVRKILLSQKTFANHLSDYEALSALAASNPTTTTSQPSISTPIASIPRAAPGTATPHLTSKGTRSHKKKDPNAVSTPTPLRRVSSAAQLSHASSSSTPIKSEPSTIPLLAAPPSLSQGNSKPPAPHPGDNDALLISRIPGMPSQEEVERLLKAPPLSYNEARGAWVEEDRRKPVRGFCEVCGYWGGVRCRGCEARVCALACLKLHDEECTSKRYGA